MNEIKDYVKEFFRTSSIEVIAIIIATVLTQQFWTGYLVSNILARYTSAIIFIFNAILIGGAFTLASYLHKRTGKKYTVSPILFSVISIILSIYIWQNPLWCFDRNVTDALEFKVQYRNTNVQIPQSAPTSFNEYVFRVQPATPIDIELVTDDRWLTQSNYRVCDWVGFVDGAQVEGKDNHECILGITTGRDDKDDLIRLDLSQPSCKNRYSEAIVFTLEQDKES